MIKQKFRVTLDIQVELEAKPCLSEALVGRQVKRFLRYREITKGLASGNSNIEIVDVLETYRHYENE